MTISRFAPTIAALTLVLIAPLSFAQYVWTDDRGVKQFSDMPPPASVPKNRILKQPAGGSHQEAPRAETPQASAKSVTTAGEAPKGPMTTAERNAEFNKRRMEQAEQEKKAAQQAEQQAAQAKNCERVRNYARVLQSDQRIANTDSNGERVFLSDERRAQELRDAQRALADCK